MTDLHPPVVDGPWLRPSAEWPAEPRWGHPDGIQLGLHPLPGPRGLLRIYAPYLGLPDNHVINFIAIEPTARGESGRGYSELEHSSLDPEQGKRLWSIDAIDRVAPQSPTSPTRGTVNGDRLEVAIGVERFDNGAEVALLARFRADRPHEIAFSAVRRPTSTELDTCVLTATMGNYARLRRLHLAERVVTPDDLWPGFSGEAFTEHASFPVSELARDGDGTVVVGATSDEPDPAAARYADTVQLHWRYRGQLARQTWMVRDPSDDLVAQVNARRLYWASTAPIPGGASFENVELVEPYRDDRTFVFRVEPMDREDSCDSATNRCHTVHL